jgi:hypothetical protein
MLERQFQSRYDSGKTGKILYPPFVLDNVMGPSGSAQEGTLRYWAEELCIPTRISVDRREGKEEYSRLWRRS